MSRIIIESDPLIPDDRALQMVQRVIAMGNISKAPGKSGHMQYCYHTTFTDGYVAAYRLPSGTHKFRVVKELTQ